MTPEERIAAKKISRIMRAARKQLGLTQENVAARLGISQSALSKLEHGTLIPSAPQWFEFCQYTQIATESLLTGYIERNAPAVIEEGLRKGSFKLPKKYGFSRGSKARTLLPFFSFMQKALGDEKFSEYFKHVKVDADFFIDLDNQVSLEFSLDMARHLIQQGHLKTDGLSELTAAVRQPRAHGSLRGAYDAALDRANRVETLVANARLYECNFTYRIEDKKADYLDLSATPGAHLSPVSLKGDPVLGDFLTLFKKSYFESFLQYGSPSTEEGDGAHQARPEVEVLESLAVDKSRCLFRVPLAT